MSPVIKHNFKTKLDFLNFVKGTANIPIMCYNGLHYIKNHGWSVDGGLTHRNPPKEWNETLIISPWRKSSKNIIGPSKSIPKILLFKPDFNLCKKVFDQGLNDASIWSSKYLK